MTSRPHNRPRRKPKVFLISRVFLHLTGHFGKLTRLHPGSFEQRAPRDNIPANLSDKGEFQLPRGEVIEVSANDLIEKRSLGREVFGIVTIYNFAVCAFKNIDKLCGLIVKHF